MAPLVHLRQVTHQNLYGGARGQLAQHRGALEHGLALQASLHRAGAHPCMSASKRCRYTRAAGAAAAGGGAAHWQPPRTTIVSTLPPASGHQLRWETRACTSAEEMAPSLMELLPAL